MSLLPRRWGFLMPIVFAPLCQLALAAAGDPGNDPSIEELAARSLIVVLKQGPSDLYWPDEIAKA